MEIFKYYTLFTLIDSSELPITERKRDMKYREKNYNRIFLTVGLYLLFNSGVFATNTKQMINNILAKYGISAGGKGVCDTPEEPEYDVNSGVVRCNREKSNGYRANNYWVPSERLCKACPYGTILNKNTYQSCNEIKCQDGMELALPNNKKCPEGYELIKITNGNCPNGFELVELNEECPDGYERFRNN